LIFSVGVVFDLERIREL
jgi:hypothetical protein